MREAPIDTPDSIVNRIRTMEDNEWREFEFAEKQLGVVDSKANNVLMVDSVLIVISTLSILFDKPVDPVIKALSTIATIFVLVSVVFCLGTIWIKWADNQKSITDIRNLRDKKTHRLNTSVGLLFTSLAFYVAMFVVDFVLILQKLQN